MDGELSSIEAALPTCSADDIDHRFEKLSMDRLGRGGFADVFRVFYCERDAILKQYRSTRAGRRRDDERDDRRKMLVEARCMDVLGRHANICRLIGVCKVGTYRGMIIEYCGGSNLQDVLEKLSESGKRIDSLLVNRWCAIIADAMEFMSRYYVHCDLKLENLLLKEKACICGRPEFRRHHFRNRSSSLSICDKCNGIQIDTVTIKISDFGLAQRVGDEPEERTGGTIQFMAPEVLGDRHVYTEKSDVYAFGVIMFTLMLGRPFGDSDDIDIVLQKLRRNTALDANNCASVSITQLIRACTLVSPEERPTFKRLNRLLGERFDAYSKLKTSKARDEVNREREAFIREYVHLIVRKKVIIEKKMPNFEGYDNPEYIPSNSECTSTKSLPSESDVDSTSITSLSDKIHILPRIGTLVRKQVKRLLKL